MLKWDNCSLWWYERKVIVSTTLKKVKIAAVQKAASLESVSIYNATGRSNKLFELNFILTDGIQNEWRLIHAMSGLSRESQKRIIFGLKIAIEQWLLSNISTVIKGFIGGGRIFYNLQFSVNVLSSIETGMYKLVISCTYMGVVFYFNFIWLL